MTMHLVNVVFLNFSFLQFMKWHIFWIKLYVKNNI